MKLPLQAAISLTHKKSPVSLLISESKIVSKFKLDYYNEYSLAFGEYWGNKLEYQNLGQ